MARSRNEDFVPVKLINKQQWLFSSQSDWEKFCFAIREQNHKPSNKLCRIHAAEVNLSSVDLSNKADNDKDYFYREGRDYMGYSNATSDEKDKTIIRQIASTWVHWPNRRSYGKLMMALHLANAYGNIVYWESLNNGSRPIELPTDDNGSLVVENLDNWTPDNYDAEWRRLTGIGDLIDSLRLMNAS